MKDHFAKYYTVTALYDIGWPFDVIATITIGDPLGRKKTILLRTTIVSVGAILQVSAFSVPQMADRHSRDPHNFINYTNNISIIAGTGNGINTSTAPV